MLKRGSLLLLALLMSTELFGASVPDIGPAWLTDSYFITRNKAWGHDLTEACGVCHGAHETFSEAWSVPEQLLYVMNCVTTRRYDVADESMLLINDMFDSKGLTVNGTTALICDGLYYYLLGLPITQETLAQLFDCLQLDDKTGLYGQSCFEAYDYAIHHSTTMNNLYVANDAAWTFALWQRQLDIMNLLSHAINKLVATTVGPDGIRTEVFKVESILPHITENQDALYGALAGRTSDDVAVVELPAIDEEIAVGDGASDSDVGAPAPDNFSVATPRISLVASSLAAVQRVFPSSVRAVVFTDPEGTGFVSAIAAHTRRPADPRGLRGGFRVARVGRKIVPITLGTGRALVLPVGPDAPRAHSPIKWST